MVIIVMGVAGAGKSTIGQLLARRLGCDFRDADDLHPAANREKMHRGIALTDPDREPWLAAVRAAITQYVTIGVNSVIACSALKQGYRDRLMVDPAAVKFVYLKGERGLIARRLADRHGHFFDKELLQSQFETLEEPRDAIVEDAARTPAVIVDSILAKLAA